jgi:hypothetical protein
VWFCCIHGTRGWYFTADWRDCLGSDRLTVRKWGSKRTCCVRHRVNAIHYNKSSWQSIKEIIQRAARNRIIISCLPRELTKWCPSQRKW